MDIKVGSRNPVLLHVEDDDAMAYLLRLALREQDVEVDVFRSSDGDDALEFLLRGGLHERAPRPDIVVLDINVPKKNGYDILAEIRQTTSLQDLTVVMLTSSIRPQDRELALSLGANDYICKPNDLHEFFQVAQTVSKYLPSDRA